MKKRILSGIQPSGELHLGNYFGMMSRMIEYQEKNDLFCCIVNLHALTTIDDKNIFAFSSLISFKPVRSPSMNFVSLASIKPL